MGVLTAGGEGARFISRAHYQTRQALAGIMG